MPIRHYWYYADRIFYVLLEGDLTPEEITGSDERVADILSALQQEEPRYVHVILDHRSLNSAPPVNVLISLTTGTEARKRMGKAIRSGWVIDLGVPMKSIPLLRFYQAVNAQKNNIHYRQFDTLEECIDFLRQVDERLPPLAILSVEQMAPAAPPSTENTGSEEAGASRFLDGARDDFGSQ